jgi:hypothetical protein
LSYRRSGGFQVARWLHELHRRRFLLLFDTQGIEHGERFDRRIDRAVRIAPLATEIATWRV